MPYKPGDLILNNKYRIEALPGRRAFGEVYRLSSGMLASGILKN
jgi:hypothetical protein